MFKKYCPMGHSYDENLSECPFCRKPDLVDLSESKKVTRKMDQPPEEPKAEKPMPKKDQPAPVSTKNRTQVLGDKKLQTGEKISRAEQRKLVALLVTYDIDEYGKCFELYQGRNIVGREPGDDIMIPDNYVSKEHALILCRDEKFFLEDSASSNGTYLNEQVLNPRAPVEIKDGDIISITKKYKFYFRTCIPPTAG